MPDPLDEDQRHVSRARTRIADPANASCLVLPIALPETAEMIAQSLCGIGADQPLVDTP